MALLRCHVYLKANKRKHEKQKYGGGGVLHTLLQVTVIESFFNHLLNSPHIYPHNLDKILQDRNGQVHHFYAHKSPENMGLLGIKANKR